MAKDTKERLLDAAEEVFADAGFDAASLRAITGGARANLAAVHYHFGSKAALFRAVYERRIAPINARRLEQLDAIEAAAGAQGPPLEAVVRAFVQPACSIVRSGDDSGARFLRLSGRMFSEPGEHWQGVAELFAEVKQRFLAAFRRGLPHLDEREVLWRMHFLLGAMCHTLAAGPLLTFFSAGACDGEDLTAAVEQLVPFLAAGLRAPAVGAAAAVGGSA